MVPGEASPRERWSLLLLLSVSGAVLVPSVVLSTLLFRSVPGSRVLVAVDRAVLEAAVRQRTSPLNRVVEVYSLLGGPLAAVVGTMLAVLGLAVLWRSRTPVLLMLVAGAGSLVMSMTGKALEGRERPPQGLSVGELEPSFSFPSGHALNATIIAGVLAYLVVTHTRSARLTWTVTALAVTHSLLMGLSRVYLGQHWLTDVVVAWFMASAWLVVVLTAHQLLLRRAAAAGRDEGDDAQ